MGSSSMLGLLFEIDANPSKAAAAVGEFERQTGAAAKKISDAAAGSAVGFRQVSGEILTSRESAHLLSEEFGLHLPRAVTSAMTHVGGLNSALTALGPIAIAAFGAMELPKIIKGIEDAASAVGGFTKELQGVLDKTAALNRELLSAPAQVMQEFRRASLERQTLTKALDDQAGAMSRLLGVQIKDAEQAGNLALVYKNSATPALRAAANEVLRLQGELKGNEAEIDRLNQALPKLQHFYQQQIKGAAAHEHVARASRDAAKAHDLLAKAEHQAGLEAERVAKAMQAQADAERFVTEQNLSLALNLEKYGVVSQRYWGDQRAFIEAYLPKVEVAIAQTYRWAEAEKILGDARAVAAAQGAAGILSALGWRRAAAGVEAVWETAQGMGQVAAALNPYDPAHAAHWASAIEHFASAAEYGIIAGTSGGSRRGGGGGYTGGGGSNYGGGGGRSEYAPVPMGPQTSQPVINHNWHIYGTVVSVDTLQELFAQVNDQVNAVRLTVISSHTLSTPVPRS